MPPPLLLAYSDRFLNFEFGNIYRLDDLMMGGLEYGIHISWSLLVLQAVRHNDEFIHQKMVNNLIQISKSIVFLVLLAFGFVVKRKPAMLDLAIGKKKVAECMRFLCGVMMIKDE